MVDSVDGKQVGKVGLVGWTLDGKVVGTSREEMERKCLLCPRWAVNRTKEATGKHGRSKHSAPCMYCKLGTAAYWILVFTG